MPRHRRTYLVDRSFQLKYVVLLAGWGLVLAVLFGLWIWQAHEHATDLVLRAAGAAAGAVERSDRYLLRALAGIGALGAVALGLVGFLMSHRVAGPVYVLGRELRLLAQGRFPEPRSLRRGDELKNVFVLFQEAVRSLRDREQRRVSVLEELLGTLRAASARVPELGAAIPALEAEVRASREALDGGPSRP
jgi:hypothetical protein